MEKILALSVILVIISYVFYLLNKKGKGWIIKKKEWLPYIKKSFLLTRAEHDFFRVLERVVSNRYYVFPQLTLDKIVLLDGKGSLRGGYRNKINKKSADFVLFDKQDISPVLVIELDDHTHQRPERQERDEFVNRLLNHCGIPILHIRSIPKEEELKTQIEAIIKI